MNLRLLLYLVLFLLSSVWVIGATKNSGQVYGVVQDASGQGIPYVSIEIYTKTEPQNLLTGSMSDENGYFVVEDVPFGEYEMVLTAIGFEDKVLDIYLTSDRNDLGIILIGEEAIILDGVEIRAETSQYRTEIDKRVIDVGKDLVSSGADAAAVLNNIPSVSVDQQTGQLSLRGNENVKVMVDGKPTNIPVSQLLKQLPSNAISKVEIITNPSAKYEPEGNSGIINIITQKNVRRGYHLGLDLGVTHGEDTRHNASVNTNINTGKFNFFGNYNSNLGKSLVDGNMDNYETLLNQYFNIHNDNKSQLFKIGFDWFISENSALTIYTIQNFFKGDGISHSDLLDKNNDVLYKNFSKNIWKYRNQDYSLNFKHDFNRTDHHIVLDAIYSKSKNDDFRDFTNEFPLLNAPHEYLEKRDGTNQSTRINLDYTNQLAEAGKIEIGVQFREEKTKNQMNSTQEVSFINSEEEIISYNPEINYDFVRDIYSAYANYGQKFGGFAMQLGIRLEKVDEKSDFDVSPTAFGDYKNDYVEFYPSAFFTYDLTEKGQLALSYSRRVDRPSVSQLTPVPEWSTSTMLSLGNPKLKPQFTNSIELGYLQKFSKGSIHGNLFYRKVNDMIFSYLEENQEDPTITNQMFINYEDTESYGFELSGNYRPTNWWNFNASFDVFAQKLHFGNEKTTGTPWGIRLNNNLNLTKNLSAQNFFMYRGKYKFVQGEAHPMWRMDLGLRYTFMDNKASVTARISDVFKTFYSETDISNPFNGGGKFKWDSQTLYVGFSYTLGGNVRKRNIIQENSQQTPSGGSIGF